MRTLALNEPFTFGYTETPEPPAPGAGEALVAVRRIGICGTDYHAYRGRQAFFTYPRILGHELGVEVIAVGANAGPVRVGDRCAVEPYMNCGACIACKAGKTNCCTSLKVLGVHTDGGMRERIVVPAAKLHRSETLDLDQLALVETLGIGAHAVDRAGVKAGEHVLVIGAGPIGLTVVQFASAAVARVTVMDINEDRLSFCRRQLNVAHTMAPHVKAVEELTEVGKGELPTAVFDATGNAQSMQEAINYAASTARVVFVGIYLGDVSFYDPEFHRKELTLLASRNSTAADFKRIVGLMESEQIDTAPWISHRADFGALAGVFPDWLNPGTGVIKAVVSVE